MAASVVRAARTQGVVGTELRRLSTAHALAMERRVALLDDHDPAYLHPGRTVLILLRDAGVSDGRTLAAGALGESLDAAFRVDHERIAAAAGRSVADLVGALPRPGDEGWVEALVIAAEDVALVALAERLDQLRHAHLRPDLDWGALHAEARDVWGPLAERTHPRLAGRYAHWVRSFAKRLDGPVAGGSAS